MGYLLPNRGWNEDLAASHPDGRPWRKACLECAFRRHNPQGLTEDDFDSLYLARDFGGLDFVCAHRSDAGFTRTCACWAAIEAGRLANAEASTSPDRDEDAQHFPRPIFADLTTSQVDSAACPHPNLAHG